MLWSLSINTRCCISYHRAFLCEVIGSPASDDYQYNSKCIMCSSVLVRTESRIKFIYAKHEFFSFKEPQTSSMKYILFINSFNKHSVTIRSWINLFSFIRLNIDRGQWNLYLGRAKHYESLDVPAVTSSSNAQKAIMAL